MTNLAEKLRHAVITEEVRLRAISDSAAESRPGAHSLSNAAWSKKEELGHLIDSATNNRVRFVKGALEHGYAGPTYDGVGWVKLGGYADMKWTDLVDLWASLNRALAVVLDRIPQDRLASQCRVAEAQPVTLEFLIDDYILHMQHHLDHVTG